MQLRNSNALVVPHIAEQLPAFRAVIDLLQWHSSATAGDQLEEIPLSDNWEMNFRILCELYYLGAADHLKKLVMSGYSQTLSLLPMES